MAETQLPPAVQVDPAALKARNRRNLWLGLALGGFVVLVLVVTLIRLNSGVGVPDRM